MKTAKNIWYFDNSLVFLILANIVTIFLAIYNQWDFTIVVWVYWWQSVIIGFFNFIKILNLKNFTTEGFKINGRPAQPTNATRRFTAFFFLFHYGFFHFVYLFFLSARTGIDVIVVWPIMAGVIVFLINHTFSFIRNFKHDTERRQNIGKVMFWPYARIFPMHLIIIFGSLLSGQIALVLFLILKTVADLVMHQIEHARNKKGELSHV